MGTCKPFFETLYLKFMLKELRSSTYSVLMVNIKEKDFPVNLFYIHRNKSVYIK